jgi:hypothetical protein
VLVLNLTIHGYREQMKTLVYFAFAINILAIIVCANKCLIDFEVYHFVLLILNIVCVFVNTNTLKTINEFQKRKDENK